MRVPRPRAVPIKKGDVIERRWVVVERLGEGGCGSVWRCRHIRRHDEEVALKVLENLADEDRFRRERRILEGARSPYVVRLIDSGRHQGFPYLALEFMAGGSLRDLLERRKRLPAPEAAWVLIMAIRGLIAAKTVHRDLKPENLLLTRPGRQGELRLIPGDPRRGSCVKVADFGLAKAWDPSMTKLTKTGQVMGTPLYMSPEQCRNTRDVTVQCDIYALGVMLYEMVEGAPPFDADNAYDLMGKHCNDPVPRGQRLEPRVQAIVDRCMAKEPEQRYRQLRDLERELADIAGLRAGAERIEAQGGGWSWSTWVILVAGVAAFAAIAWILREELRRALGW